MTLETDVPTTHYSPTSAAKRRRIVARGVVGGAATLAFAASMLTPSFAAAGDTSDGTTNAHVDVTTAITLSGLTPDFTLDGIPGATVDGPAAVTATVETNNFAGYSVTVQSEAATMLPVDVVANVDSIPIGALSVTNSAGVLTPLSSTATVLVATKGTRSVEGGDAISNDYQVVIPFVNEDTYSATLDYVATTL